MTNATETLWNTSIARNVEALQDKGYNVWIVGFSADGSRALIANGEENARTLHVAPVSQVNGIGRFENRMDCDMSLYYDRFPIR